MKISEKVMRHNEISLNQYRVEGFFCKSKYSQLAVMSDVQIVYLKNVRSVFVFQGKATPLANKDHEDIAWSPPSSIR